MKKDFRYTTENGNEIPITLYGADRFIEQPCIVYIHGFKGFKDWGFVPYAGEYFASRGFSFLTFNFSHNGIGENPLEFTELDKFEQNTFSLEVSEAREMIHLCSHSDLFGGFLRHKLGVLGHSRGGGIALLASSDNPQVSAVATWSSVSHFDRFDKKTRANWRKAGYLEVVNSRTGQVFRMGTAMLEDVEKNAKSKLNILNAARELNKPLILIHGEADEAVPYYEAETLNIYSDPARTAIKLIPKAGHTFGAKHPFEGTTPELEAVLQYSLTHFKKHLS
jgi:dipeptidyl aminopeptidase/acylaminoacyl peptidase